MKRLFALASVLVLSGCKSFPKMFSPSVGERVADLTTELPKGHGLALLSWVGGIATLAGIAALVVTRGSMGMRAVIAGICLVVLNIVIANYLSWIMIPALVGTGCISLCWAFVTIRKLMNKDKCNDG
jgi:hypothetical protein|tara:strand:+ start:669 stop:1049 length:381 start_codon:yes stop_codon:yes gene_type:complete